MLRALLDPVKLAGPEPFEPRYPVAHGLQLTRIETVKALLAALTHRNQPDFAKHSQVLRDGRLRHPKPGHQLADCLFRPEGDSQLSDDVWRAVEGGFLRAVSVGFTPTGPINELVDSAGNWIGYEFTSQELLELSVVPVPANPQALAVAKSLGIADATARLLFTPDPRAVAQVAVDARRRSIDLLKAQRRAG